MIMDPVLRAKLERLCLDVDAMKQKPVYALGKAEVFNVVDQVLETLIELAAGALKK